MVWNLNSTTRFFQVTQTWSVLFLAIWRIEFFLAMVGLVQVTTGKSWVYRYIYPYNPWKLTAGYPKWWALENVSPFRYGIFFLSILNFWGVSLPNLFKTLNNWVTHMGPRCPDSKNSETFSKTDRYFSLNIQHINRLQIPGEEVFGT